ncbi:hypothetical protein [Paludisphaera borealis]|uniref:hypothetical protein n=1 Tax=Paludisphaera borealis TaxID=1387353 RepID=UPI0011AB68C2|nr:hypothetical protein [Paludisphaera borealis]
MIQTDARNSDTGFRDRPAKTLNIANETTYAQANKPLVLSLAQGQSVAAPAEDPMPPDLALIVTHWAELPDALRAGIVAMVRASVGNSDLSRLREAQTPDRGSQTAVRNLQDE